MCFKPDLSKSFNHSNDRHAKMLIVCSNISSLNQKKKKLVHKFLILEKNVFMYAGAPKIAQELFFWGYHLRSVHPTEENILLLNNM